MILYLLRHGVAAEREEWQGEDELRPLTASGAAKMKKTAAGIYQLIPKLDLILTSPLVRARQTAEIVVKAFDLKHEKFRETAALAPESRFEALFQELKQQPAESQIMLVGHQPYLGDLLAYLITYGSTRNIPLRKGGLACIVLETMEPRITGTLQWLVTPKQLRLIAEN